ncbi:hypothetical protein CMQ_5506 [Grosmannia clavigera kw1407]|uniref:Cytochrome b561 domain-containing protein n=1 Tax=Grosmannia clavigera (strain kw1407 / UAMH 11150) TaxID=655863 RepID=F0XSI9_GROCL|nr:uncharacterized protein CMQ_5506 [Grosmannia clavigera kw1407]EFW99085.1 hypothetical protein CMQ_5506 [Grosmannia clavigera kw1407]
MAPVDTLAAAGSSSYSSNTLEVGDGTWDYTKNDFLLPNLEGLNFATMRYNGMGNRFSSIAQYHSLVTGHAVMGAITFLVLIPISVMIARFSRSRSGHAIRYHTYLNVVAAMFSTVVLILGWFAVGPRRSLSNPHHGIGIAIYTLIMVQTIGGRLVRHLAGRHSLRLNLHRWTGRAVALLGIVQVPLGLTLYGSPKVLFILFAIWMAFLLLVYFVLSHRQGGSYRSGSYHSSRRSSGRKSTVVGGSSAGGSSGGGMMRWIAPLAAGAGAWALFRGRNKARSRSRSRVDSRSRADSRSRSRSRSRSFSRSRTDMMSSHRGSESFVEDEKYRNKKPAGGGFMSKMMAAGAAGGAGALFSNLLSKRKDRNRDEEYSAVETDTPSRYGRNSQVSRAQRPPPRRQPIPQSEISSYFTEDESSRLPARTTSPTPASRRGHGVGKAVAVGAAAGAAAGAASSSRRNNDYDGSSISRPVTPPRPSHQRHQSVQDNDDVSDDSPYQSPSQRTPAATRPGNTAKTGMFGGMGLGWIANKIRGGRTAAEDEDDGRLGGQGNPTPLRRDRRSETGGSGRPPTRMQSMSDMTDSVLDPVSSLAPAAPVIPGQGTSNPRRSGQVSMPAMPDSDVSSVLPTVLPQRQRRDSQGQGESSRRAEREREREREREQERRPTNSGGGSSSNNPVSVRLRVHDDRGGNVTLRRLTDEEAAAERAGGGSQQQFQPAPSQLHSQPSQPSQRSQQPRRRYDDSASSLSEVDSPSTRRYRRDSNGIRRAEQSAERRTTEAQQQMQSPPQLQLTNPSESTVHAPLDPPNPPFAGGRRPKDSTYYSGGAAAGRGGGGESHDEHEAESSVGAAGPSNNNNMMHPAGPDQGTLSSIVSQDTHGTWSAMSPSPRGRRAAARPGSSGRQGSDGASTLAPDLSGPSAAERRRRRRLERSETSRQPSRVDYQ